MRAKNTTLIARRKGIIDELGEEAWIAFVRKWSDRFPILAQPLVATSSLPIDEFLQINDEILKHFYKGRDKHYLDLGRASAQWALTEGPYKRFVQQGIEPFVKSLPLIWTTYYSETPSRIVAELDERRVVHLKVLDLGMWHAYFEYLVVGYVQRGLEIVTDANVPCQAVKSGPSATNEIYYRLFAGSRARDSP